MRPPRRNGAFASPAAAFVDPPRGRFTKRESASRLAPMAGWAKALRDPKVWARDVVFTAGSAVTIALLGPYGTYDEPLDLRLARSAAIGFAGSIWLWQAMRQLLFWGERAGLPYLFCLVGGLMVLTVPVAISSDLVSELFGPGGTSPTPAAFYLAVLALVLPMGAAYLHVDRWIERAHAPPSPGPANAAEPRIFARIPGRLGRDLLALQAEDHYVRVHTAAGSDLLLMRMADAIAETDGVDGLRVHRSWWVARQAVESARSEGRRATLTLKGGLNVPVTRETVPEIRRAGWL